MANYNTFGQGMGPMKTGGANFMSSAPFANQAAPQQGSMGMSQWQMPDYTQPLQPSPAELMQQQARTNQVLPYKSITQTAATTNGQDTPWGWGGKGGKAATGISAISALGGLYLGNEARKLAASDLDFRRGSFEKQYQSQRSLVNGQMFDRQQRREREGGLSDDQARAAADAYVKNRGVQ